MPYPLSHGVGKGWPAASALAIPILNPIKIATVGSSTPQGFLNSFGDPIYATDSVTKSDDGITFTRLENGRWGQQLGPRLVAATGRPVKFVSGAVASTTLLSWEAGGAGSDLAKAIIAINNAGGVDALFLQVGFNDVRYGVFTSYAEHLAKLRSLISKIRTGTNLPNLVVFIGITQDHNSEPAITYVRQAEATLIANDANIRIGCVNGDIATIDGVHTDAAGHIIQANRFFPQMMALLNGTAQVRGPRPISAAKVTSTTTDITVQHGAGNDLSPTTGMIGFATYNAAGTLISKTVTGVRQSANVIRVTHAADPASITAGDCGNQETAADTNFPLDNSAYLLPLEPSAGFLAIAGSTAVAPLTIAGPLPAATQGAAYSFTPTTGGGSGTKTFALSGAALPTGYSFSTATGAITAAAGNAAPAGSTTGLIITVTDTSGSANTGSLTLTIAAVSGTGPTGKSSQVSFRNSSDAAGASGWNVALSDSAQTPLALNTPAGATSGWSFVNTGTIISGNWANNGPTGSGIYPDPVLQSYWYWSSSTGTPRVETFEISGLDNSKVYDVTLGAFRGLAPRGSRFTINGVSKTQDASQKTSATLFDKIAPTGGKITFSVTHATGLSGGDSPSAYLNSVVITEFTP